MKDENSLKVEIHDNYKLDGEIQNTENKYYFIFHQRKLLLVNNEIPLISGLDEIYIKEADIKNKIFIGLFYDNDCFAVELNEYSVIEPVLKFLNFVLTIAAPFPGLTC